jgi:hypothetical protein
MIASRSLSAVLLAGSLALAGCGSKADSPRAAPAAPERKGVVPPVEVTINEALKEPPKPPEAVLVSPEDKARISAAEKQGAAAYEGTNGGYEVRIERDADAGAVLAALAGAKCVVGLSVEGDSLTDAALAPAGGFEQLERLTLHNCPKLTGAGFEALAKLPRLKAVAVSECPLADGACKSLGRVKSLEEVRLVRTKVTDAGLRELAALPALELLGLEGMPASGTGFASPGWPKLRDLDAARSGLTDAGMKAVAELPALVSLRVDGCAVTDAGLLPLERAKKLAELSLSETKVTDAGLEVIRGVKTLRTLEVANTAVTGVGFGRAEYGASLRKLDAGGAKIDDSGAGNLARFPGLTSLSLAGCPVSDAGLAGPLKRMKSLSKCDLSGTQVGDEAAKAVGALPGLEDANFARTKLTDAGLKALASRSKVRLIDARGTNVTKEGAARAKMGRNRLEVRAE